MTKTATIEAIKAIGRELTVKYIREFNEYRVSFNITAIQLVRECDYNEAKERNEDHAYYTEDAEDAINTARAMHDCFVNNPKGI